MQRPKVQADWQWERRRSLSPSPLGRWGKPENIYKYAHAYTRTVTMMHLGSIGRGEERIKHLDEPVAQAQTFQVIPTRSLYPKKSQVCDHSFLSSLPLYQPSTEFRHCLSSERAASFWSSLKEELSGRRTSPATMVQATMVQRGEGPVCMWVGGWDQA